MAQLDDHQDVRPIPDPTLLTTAQLDREIAHLKELIKRDLESLDRRLLELPQLRDEIVKVRGEFVRVDVYHPAHEELRRQRQADSERMVQMMGEIKTNSNGIARLESSMMWLSRLVIAALIGGVIAYAFQRLLVR